MTLFKSLAAAFIAIVLVGLSPVKSHAAEATKKVAGDRITPPTKIKPLDINSGSIDQLKTLPGIDEGDAHQLKTLPGIDEGDARRIVEGRPYQKKDELVSRKIIPEATYKKIKDRIITVSYGFMRYIEDE